MALSKPGIFAVKDMAIIPSTTGPGRLVITDSAGAIITWDLIGPLYGTAYLYDASGGLTSTAIPATWISKEFNIEYGTFKWIVIYLLKQPAGNLTIKWSIDQQASVSYTQDMTIGRGQIIRAKIPIMQKGSTIQLTLSNNTASQTFKIYGIKIYYEPSIEESIL